MNCSDECRGHRDRACMHARDARGKTPLLKATMADRALVAQQLLYVGADTSIQGQPASASMRPVLAFLLLADSRGRTAHEVAHAGDPSRPVQRVFNLYGLYATPWARDGTEMR